MPIRLDARAPDFPRRFQSFLSGKRETAEDIENDVRAILADVAARGDRALVELSRKLDGVDLGALGIQVGQKDIDNAAARCNAEALDALTFARDRIEAYHHRQLP